MVSLRLLDGLRLGRLCGDHSLFGLLQRLVLCRPVGVQDGLVVHRGELVAHVRRATEQSQRQHRIGNEPDFESGHLTVEGAGGGNVATTGFLLAAYW